MVFGELLAALLNASAGRRSLSDGPQLLAQRVLLGREGRELLVPEFDPLGLRERCHCMDHGSLPLRQFVDLTHQVDDFRHVLAGFRVVLAVEPLDVEDSAITISLPRKTPPVTLPDKSFELAVCAHFLFLYTEHLSEAFHGSAILELRRVADAVRIFPLLALDGRIRVTW